MLNRTKLLARLFGIAVLCQLIPATGFSQLALTLQSAIDSALLNNFQVRIARNNAAIGQLNNNTGTAGMLPSVGINAGDNQSYNTIHQELNTGTVINKDNASGNLLTGSLSASMTLFNGLKISAEKERLHYLQLQGEQLLNSEIQNTIAAVMVNYYDIVRQQRYLATIIQSLSVSEKKLELITLRKNIGLANDADYLQAQTDVASSEQIVAQQNTVLQQSIISLQQLMGVKDFSTLIITDTILVDSTIKSEEVISALKNNPDFLAADQQVSISEQISREITAQRYPSLKIGAGYNFSRNVSDAGLTLVSQSYGPTAGVTLQIPLYNGNAYRVQQRAAKYAIDNASINREQVVSALNASALKAYTSYSSSLSQLAAQVVNFQRADKLLQLVLQRYQLNQSTVLDLKVAQASYENAGFLLVNLQFAAKASEVELKRLVFGLK
jgi:outer membrane protein TolC